MNRIIALRCYLEPLRQAVAAMPSDKASAEYLDLDNVRQLRGDLDEAVESLCDVLGMEICRLVCQRS